MQKQNLGVLNMLNTTDYTVARRPIEVANAKGADHWDALVNETTDEVISVVTKNYRLIQNHEVFGEIENNLKGSISKEQYDGANVVEQVSKGGLWAKKEWRFPDVKVPSTDDSKSDINFRVIGVNSFGSSAIKCFYGGIDFFCMNGMIVGEQVGMIRKAHYGGFEIQQFVNPVGQAIEQFKTQGETWIEWQNKEITQKRSENFLNNVFSVKVAALLIEQFKKESIARGLTVWALYSAMTAYASHADKFGVSTIAENNRNVAGTMHSREISIKNVIQSDNWKKLTS